MEGGYINKLLTSRVFFFWFVRMTSLARKSVYQFRFNDDFMNVYAIWAQSFISSDPHASVEMVQSCNIHEDEPVFGIHLNTRP